MTIKQKDVYKNIFDDPCYSMPCFNDGKCSVLNSRFKCDCLPGFHGTYCEAGKIYIIYINVIYIYIFF